MHCDTNRTQLQSGLGECRPRLASLFYPGGLQNKMPPLSSLRRRRHPVFYWLLATCISCVTACSTPKMQVDGLFTDWPDATNHVLADGSTLWIELRTEGRPVNLQQLDEPMRVRLRLDEPAPQTIEIEFSPEPGGMGVGMSRMHADGRLEVMSPYELDVMFAPTVAADRFELAVDLAPLLTTATDVHVSVPSRKSATVRVNPRPADRSARIPPRADDALRIVSWNVQFGELLKQRDRSAAILQALAPDVLLLQELEDDQTADALCAFLGDTLGTDPAPWQAAASPVGTRLRSMVAARSDDQTSLRTAILLDGEPIRVAMLHVRWHDRLWLAGSIHLQCCGGIDGPEDATRIAQVAAINDAIDRMSSETPCAGAILGGDLNLVGSDTPLRMLVEERDRSGHDALIADGLQLDDRSAVTWTDVDSRFTPGRLDWIVYTGSSLRQTRSFVLDCEDLSADALERHGLHHADTASVSDHLPLVLDVAIR
jgi:endonuclease/exonuclease/phosphatase family metal-dependent hydrolase